MVRLPTNENKHNNTTWSLKQVFATTYSKYSTPSTINTSGYQKIVTYRHIYKDKKSMICKNDLSWFLGFNPRSSS